MQNISLAAFPNQLYFTFPGWKRKTLTFTYDDGTIHDIRLVRTLNRYGLKGTFNIAPGCLNGAKRICLSDIEDLYRGHEVASHGYYHLHLDQLTQQELENEIRDGRSALEDTLGIPIRGFASPYGIHGDNAINFMRKNDFAYARSCAFTQSLSFPNDWMRWGPSVHHGYNLNLLGDRFLSSTGWGGALSMLNIMGHSYEFDTNDNWNLIEDFCQRMAGNENIWYATNIEIFDYIQAMRHLRITMDGTVVENLSGITLYANYGAAHGSVNARGVVLEPGCELHLEENRPPEKMRHSKALPRVRIWSGGAFTPTYPEWKNKALTFSYDDGNISDRKVVEILDKYGMKGTFNLMSDGMPEKREAELQKEGENSGRLAESELKGLFLDAGHEIAVHGAQHATFNSVPYPCVVDDIFRNRLALEQITRHPVRGMAYPNGSASQNPQSEAIAKALGIAYARVTQPDTSFRLPENFMSWNPTAHHDTPDGLCNLGEKFLNAAMPPDMALLFIWGHSHEFAKNDNFELLEKFCALMTGQDIVWYATNIEIFEYVTALRNLNWSVKYNSVSNNSPFEIYGFEDGKKCVIPPRATLKKKSAT